MTIVPLQVAVRVRPNLRRDTKGGTDTISDGKTKLFVSGNEVFVFSQVFSQTVTQQAVFNHCAAPQVSAVLDGLDACVFAFGQ